MDFKIKPIVPFTSCKIETITKPAPKKTTDKSLITELPKTFYLHPSMMETNNGVSLSDVYKDLFKNDCGVDVLRQIEKLSPEDKELFIENFCKHTGFPNLEIVNEKMKQHTIDVMKNGAIETGTEILYCGYHNHCSSAKNLAVPGSDLDAMSVIIRGDQKNMNQMNGYVWFNFDPTIVSIRKDYETPDIYTIQQLYEWTQLTDEIIKKSPMADKTEKYLSNLKETSDYEKALEFNIDIANEISKYPVEELQKKAPALAEYLTYYGKTPKNVTQSISSLLETLRSGHPLIQGDLTSKEKEQLKKIQNSYLYKYGNICIQEANYGVKDKLLRRQEFINEENFAKMSTDDKLDLILRMLFESFRSELQKQIEPNRKYKTQFDFLFDNGEKVNEKRDKAFSQTVDFCP